eukprot:TRINITY_DN17373_c1_g1_i4.p1 TRINITY_DN17373_c1_g1~~TRINITY_DN17373_c1_g1_i4.p1  ORF type:complete len:268 (-),score=24.25 TRINITY_DN17373_c1_g1_i4:81-884(-)
MINNTLSKVVKLAVANGLQFQKIRKYRVPTKQLQKALQEDNLNLSQNLRQIPNPSQNKMKPHEIQLLLFYSSGAIIGSILVKNDIITPGFVQVGSTFVWAGFILAISLMEAWVKFKSPLLRRHIAINVGLNVFGSLQTVQCALASTVWFMYLFDAQVQSFNDVLNVNNYSAVNLGILTVLLVLQIAVVSPKLNLRGYKIQLDAFKGWKQQALVNKNFLGDKERQYLLEIEQIVAGKQIPSGTWHLFYGIIEVVKCGLLFNLAGKFYY